jgi:hypothetical protein
MNIFRFSTLLVTTLGISCPTWAASPAAEEKKEAAATAKPQQEQLLDAIDQGNVGAVWDLLGNLKKEKTVTVESATMLPYEVAGIVAEYSAPVDLEARDEEGMTPLARAIAANINPVNRLKIVIALIRSGADLYARGNIDQSLLSLAAINAKDIELIREIISARRDQFDRLYKIGNTQASTLKKNAIDDEKETLENTKRLRMALQTHDPAFDYIQGEDRPVIEQKLEAVIAELQEFVDQDTKEEAEPQK